MILLPPDDITKPWSKSEVTDGQLSDGLPYVSLPFHVAGQLSQKSARRLNDNWHFIVMRQSERYFLVRFCALRGSRKLADFYA